MARTLRAYGVRQLEGAPRSRAVQAAARAIPDVILVLADQLLKEPAVLVTELRAHAATRDTPILVRLSADGRASADTLLMAGADRVLPDGPETAALAGALFKLSDVSVQQRAIRDVRRRLAPVAHPTLVHLAAAMQDVKTIMIAAESTGRCVAANDGFVTATAFSRDDILGHALWNFVHANGGRDLRANWDTLLVVGSFQGPCALRRKYAGPAPADVYVAAHVLRDIHLAAISSAPSRPSEDRR